MCAKRKIETYFLFGLLLSLITYATPYFRFGADPEESLDLFLIVNLTLLSIAVSVRIIHSGVVIFPRALGLGIYLMIVAIMISSFFSEAIQHESIIKLIVFLSLPIIFIQVVDRDVVSKTVILFISIGVILTLYGYYGYFTGNVGDQANTFWWAYAKYWGIHYMESTRNADVYYPAILLCFVLPYIARKAKIAVKVSTYFVLFLALTAVTLSLSRGAWIATTTILIFGSYLIGKGKNTGKVNLRKFITLTLLFVSVIYFAYAFGENVFLLEKLGSIMVFDDVDPSLSSNENRVAIIREVFNVIRNHPEGVGLDNLRFVFPMYGLSINHAENNYLNILAELGVIGFAGFCILVFYPLKRLYKQAKALHDVRSEGFLLANVYLIVAYLFNVDTQGIFIWIIHSLIWGYSISGYSSPSGGLPRE
jgi:hypothetical protein